MVNISVRGRNDLDLPDEMKVILDRKTGTLTFKFDGVLKEFVVASEDATPLIQVLGELQRGNSRT